MEFAQKLRKLREQRGLSQGGLGAMIGRAQNRIHKWEDGQGFPDGNTLIRLSEALQVPLRYLCDDTLDDPEKALTGEPTYSETEKQIWTLVRSLGSDRAIARLLALPEGQHPVLPSLPAAAIDEPGSSAAPVAKHLSSQRVPRRRDDPTAEAESARPKRRR